MNQIAKLTLVIAGLVATVKATTVAASEILTQSQVANLARSVTSQYFPNVDPNMIRAMVEIESSRNKNAFRYEWHIQDASTGLMQVLAGTAKWLYDDMGYRKIMSKSPTMADMFEPRISVYFGAAYIDWLQKFHRSKKGGEASEEWLVRAYNGGPGGAGNSQTAHHWSKYQTAKAALA